MNSTQTLKEILKRRLNGKEKVEQRIYEFLLGILDAGKLVGYKEGYERGYENGRDDEERVSKKGGG